MSVGSTVKWMGRSARDRAEVVGHQLKDRALEKRLERAHEEAERLRRENDMLRDEVEGSRTEHKKIYDLLDRRLEALEDVEVKKKSHKGRWLLFLMTLGGGAYALIRMRSNGHSASEWSGTTAYPTATETSAPTP
jgi:predicted RNase H-like nuclease (RuvC/YqgF family)